MRRVGAFVVALALVVLVSACSGGLSETGEPLTVEQSEQLAQARFQLSTVGEYVATVVVGADDDLNHFVADLTVDASDQVAWGTLSRGPEGLAVQERILLGPGGYAVEQSGVWNPSPWATGGLSLLSLVFSLTADRPENAQLLRQSDAAYLGTQDGLDVFRLPSAEGSAGGTRFWLREGELVRLDDGSDALSVTVDRDASTEPRPAEIDDVLGPADE